MAGKNGVGNGKNGAAKSEIGTEIMKRPGFGTQGQKIPLKGNFYPMKFQSRAVFQYDIDVQKLDMRGNPIKLRDGKPKKIDREDMRILFDEFRRQNSGSLPSLEKIVFDGARRVFSTEQLLPKGDTEAYFTLQDVRTTAENRGSQYQIKVTHCGSISLDLAKAFSTEEQDATTMPMQVLDMVLRQAYLDGSNQGESGSDVLCLSRNLRLPISRKVQPKNVFNLTTTN